MTLPDLRMWNKKLECGEGSEALALRAKEMVDPNSKLLIWQFELLPTLDTVDRYNLEAEMGPDKTVVRKYPHSLVTPTDAGISRGRERARWIVDCDFNAGLNTPLYRKRAVLHETIRRLEAELLTAKRALASSARMMRLVSGDPLRFMTLYGRMAAELQASLPPIEEKAKGVDREEES